MARPVLSNSRCLGLAEDNTETRSVRSLLRSAMHTTNRPITYRDFSAFPGYLMTLSISLWKRRWYNNGIIERTKITPQSIKLTGKMCAMRDRSSYGSVDVSRKDALCRVTRDEAFTNKVGAIVEFALLTKINEFDWETFR